MAASLRSRKLVMDIRFSRRTRERLLSHIKPKVGNTWPKLYQGDCLVEMNKIPDSSVDLILCDLPYGTVGKSRSASKEAKERDTIVDFQKMWKAYWRILKPDGAIVLCSMQPFTTDLIYSQKDAFRYSWVWDKNRSSNFMAAKLKPLQRTEDICVFSKLQCNPNSKNNMRYNPQGLKAVNKVVINGNNVGGKVGQDRAQWLPGKKAWEAGKKYTQEFTGYPSNILPIAGVKCEFHPTQKPVELMEYLIKTYTDKGMVVLDNCMGSGTTGVACKNLDRKFIGMEKDPTYFKIASERIHAHN